MTRTVLVTGATGTVGRHVASALGGRDCAVRLGLHDPDGAPIDLASTGDVVALDFERPETWGGALDGVDGLFLVRPPAVDADAVARFGEAAARVGVDHVAYLSTIGAGKNVLLPHHRIEQRIVATDADHTLLRAAFFAQNLHEVHRRDVLEHDEIFVPAGDGATSFVDARDLGDVAAVVLTEEGHRNRAYDLTGPEALDCDAVAAIFSDVLDRRITYPDPSLVAFWRRMRRRGEPRGFVAVMCVIYTTTRLGFADRVTDDVRRVLGREPRDVRTYVADYASEFRPAP